jgi:hypothetical protein
MIEIEIVLSNEHGTKKDVSKCSIVYEELLNPSNLSNHEKNVKN